MGAEAEEDKHLDAQHVIEEAMSELSLCSTYHVPMFLNSPGTYAQLSQMPKMQVTLSLEYIILTYLRFSAFIKEMGVSAIHRNISSAHYLSSHLIT